jgi:hypothetical protein
MLRRKNARLKFLAKVLRVLLLLACGAVYAQRTRGRGDAQGF